MTDELQHRDYLRKRHHTKKQTNNKCLDIEIRCVSVINLVTDKRLDAAKPSVHSINYRQVDAHLGNLVLAYLSVP